MVGGGGGGGGCIDRVAKGQSGPASHVLMVLSPLHQYTPPRANSLDGGFV